MKNGLAGMQLSGESPPAAIWALEGRWDSSRWHSSCVASEKASVRAVPSLLLLGATGLALAAPTHLHTLLLSTRAAADSRYMPSCEQGCKWAALSRQASQAARGC